MASGVGSGQRQVYASELAGLWGDLSTTLARLEMLAADPAERLDDGALETLPRLQYSLHRASELVIGLTPPPGAEPAHAELAGALSDARDATAEVAEALATSGAEAAALLVHEWRGALFRVRLARHRLSARPASPPAVHEDVRVFPAAALAATLLVLAGAVAFTAGAILAFWPLWAGGLMLVAGGFFTYRP